MNPKAPCAKCDQCPLQDRPFVPSHLPPNAPIIAIGGGPGASEVFKGRPFVGDSGKLLDAGLLYAGLDPRLIGRTNAVLCQPVGNATPPEEAVAACSERLRLELLNHQAQDILALGGTAVYALDRLQNIYYEGTITARRGTWYKLIDYRADYSIGNHKRYFASFHPAYVLRIPALNAIFFRDIVEVVHGEEARNYSVDKVRYRVADETNVDKIISYLRAIPDNAVIALDTESRRLGWYDTMVQPTADLLCVTIAYKQYEVIVLPFYDLLRSNTRVWYDLRDELEGVLDRTRVVAQNAKYDQHVLAKQLGINFTAYADTMAAHWLLNEAARHGLKELASEYLGIPAYEEELIDAWFVANKIAKDKRDYGLLPRPILYKYASIDTSVTLVLWAIFEAKLRKQPSLYNFFFDALMPIANMLTVVEENGIKIDVPYLQQVRDHMRTQLADITQAANDLIMPLVAGREEEFTRLFRLMQTPIPIPEDERHLYRKNQKYKKVTRFNPGSDDQVSIVLYDVLKLKHTRRLAKPTSTNTGKDALDALPPNDVADIIREYRRVEKLLSTYAEGILARVSIKGYLHIDFRLTGTEIGRLSASNADHGIPRPEGDDIAELKRYGAMIRGSFVADSPDDDVLIDADYSQLELRVFAHMSEEPFLLEAYQRGEDVHNKTCEMLEELGTPFFAGYKNGSKPFKKDRRVVAKNTNFGMLVYLGGPSGVAGMLGGKIHVSVLEQVARYYKALMPTADAWQKEQFRLLRTQGYVETLFGNRRRFTLINENNIDEARKAAVHMPVSGTAGIINNLAAVELTRVHGLRVCHLIHDSILIRCKRSEAEATTLLVRDVMEEIGNRYITRVPIVAEVDVVYSWAARPELGSLKAA